MGEGRRRVVKITGISAAALGSLLLMLFVGYGMGLSGGFYDAQRDEYSAQIEHETQERIDDCFARTQPPAKAHECVENAVTASRESQQSEQDLNAQRKMADWAWWLVVITLAQTPLTLGGLILLLQTIWQGQEAIRLQKAETRPWLSFAELKIKRLNVQQLSNSPDWVVTPVMEMQVVNSGNAPAVDVRVFTQAVENPISPETEAQIDHWAKHQVESRRGFTMGVLPPNAQRPYKYAIPNVVPFQDAYGAELRDTFPGIAAFVTYRAIGDETTRQTVQVFRLSMADPEKHSDTPQATGFWLVQKSYEPNEITIVSGSKVDRAT